MKCLIAGTKSYSQDSNDAGASSLDQAENNTIESESSDSGSDENGDIAGWKKNPGTIPKHSTA